MNASSMELILLMLLQQGPELIRINAETPSLLTIDECECKTIHEFFLKGVCLSGRSLIYSEQVLCQISV